MLAEIVNLRRARKAKARLERERQAETNRVLHGQTRAEKERQAAERDRMARTLESHRRDKD